MPLRRTARRYEVNPQFVSNFNQAGFEFVGQDIEGERMEVFELTTGHRYYVGCQVRSCRLLGGIIRLPAALASSPLLCVDPGVRTPIGQPAVPPRVQVAAGQAVCPLPRPAARCLQAAAAMSKDASSRARERCFCIGEARAPCGLRALLVLWNAAASLDSSLMGGFDTARVRSLAGRLYQLSSCWPIFSNGQHYRDEHALVTCHKQKSFMCVLLSIIRL